MFIFFFAWEKGKEREEKEQVRDRENRKSKLGLKEVVRFFVTVSKLALDRRLRM